MSITLLWFCQDLRLSDNPALRAALHGERILPLYIFDPGRAPGEAGAWWLHQNLAALDQRLRQLGARLILRRGDSLAVLREMIGRVGATRVVWNRRYEPALIERDTRIKTALRAEGIECQSFKANLLHEPWQIKTGEDQPYRVFTPYWKSCRQKLSLEEPWPMPEHLVMPEAAPPGDSLDSLELMPRRSWPQKFTWQAGEAAALAKLAEFIHAGLADYSSGREAPGIPGTSGLSPYLALGVLGAPRIAYQVTRWAAMEPGLLDNAEAYLRQLGWRDFSYQLLFHYPRLQHEPMNPKFRAFPWQRDAAGLRAWQNGETGIPMVDAGMRELWETGWMHNRARMVVGSFLTKNLRLSWRAGESWFWDTLVDADLANNIQGWQWIAGCGADAAPYFRIFNPVLQGEKFDPHGEYVRRWLPALKQVADKYVHKPWEAPLPPKNYPAPLVELKASRAAALAAYQGLA